MFASDFVIFIRDRLVSGEWSDSSISDPLGGMFALLSDKRDRALIQKWGVWLTKYDLERALKVVILISLYMLDSSYSVMYSTFSY